MNRLTFGREKRLLSRIDFIACYEQGHKFFSKSFIIFVLPIKFKELDVEQLLEKKLLFGCTVTRKFGCAVLRNRIKRVIREACRLNQNLINYSAKIVIIPKHHVDAKKISLGSVQTELKPLFEKVNRKIELLSNDN